MGVKTDTDTIICVQMMKKDLLLLLHLLRVLMGMANAFGTKVMPKEEPKTRLIIRVP